jgi:23S rRNA G2069 N7-methylase RlmK/C1962 C5-methylase RlmI
MFCYSGGFALNAAAGGASTVTAVDSSQSAIDNGVANAALNSLNVQFEKGDALKWMDAAIERGQTFDIVVLDPPKVHCFYCIRTLPLHCLCQYYLFAIAALVTITS